MDDKLHAARQELEELVVRLSPGLPDDAPEVLRAVELLSTLQNKLDGLVETDPSNLFLSVLGREPERRRDRFVANVAAWLGFVSGFVLAATLAAVSTVSAALALLVSRVAPNKFGRATSRRTSVADRGSVKAFALLLPPGKRAALLADLVNDDADRPGGSLGQVARAIVVIGVRARWRALTNRWGIPPREFWFQDDAKRGFGARMAIAGVLLVPATSATAEGSRLVARLGWASMVMILLWTVALLRRELRAAREAWRSIPPLS